MKKDKKLIIHVGMPKTATTTLQRGLFCQLHNAGMINFLGKAGTLYNHIKHGKKIETNFIKMMDYILFNEGNNKPPDEIIKAGFLNILSEERICCSTHRLKTWGNNVDDSLLLPKKIYDYFNSEASEIIILLTLRNQQAMIPSSFVQMYSSFLNKPKNNHLKNYFVYNTEEISLENYLSYCLYNKNLFKVWYYDELISSYLKYFNKENIKVLFYEDFLFEKNFFIEELSNILNIPLDTISSILEGQHFNQKTKNDEGIIISVTNKKPLQKAMQRIYKNDIVRALYRPIKNNWPDNLLNKLYKNKTNKNILIKKATDEQKILIFDEFRESNRKLYSYFGIDRNKLEKYGYI